MSRPEAAPPAPLSPSLHWKEQNETCFQSQFPLHRACRDGLCEEVSALILQRGAAGHVLLEDCFYGWTPAHWAAYFGKLECLKKLVETAGSPQLPTSRFRQTPAHIAAFGGHPQCLQWLLQAGADPNSQDYLGETPLHKAVRTGSLECIALLAGEGAKLDICSSNQVTPARLAANCGFRELAQLLNHQERYLMQSTGLPSQSSGIDVSNGYYGFHPVPHRSADCGFQADASHCSNNGDVLLHRGVSVNVTAVAGCKRRREEVISIDAKRMCKEAHDGCEFDVSVLQPPKDPTNFEAYLATVHGC